ncbi:MAG: SH3 domain-containing protein [Caldilineaceae bacterium]|nr:SH3 domain-containing protein [Caldilineaceae bacterium]
MPKWTDFFGNLQSQNRGLTRILLLATASIIFSGCGGPGNATPTPLPPIARIEQPTSVFVAPPPTSTPTPELEPADGVNPVQAMIATQIAQRALEIPETATPVPTATVAAGVEENPLRRALLDTQLTRPTSMGIVGGSGAGFFASPGGALIQSLPAGTTLTITGRSGDRGWYAAYLGDGRAGWIGAGAVRIFGDVSELETVTQSVSPAIVATLIAEANRPVTPFPTTAPITAQAASTPTLAALTPAQPEEAAAAVAEPSGAQATVIVEGLNVRGGPGTDFPIVGSLVQGNSVSILARNEAGDWLQIETPQGMGWVFAPLVETSIPIAELPASPGS